MTGPNGVKYFLTASGWDLTWMQQRIWTRAIFPSTKPNFSSTKIDDRWYDKQFSDKSAYGPNTF